VHPDSFTHQIIGKAMETHRFLGPGLTEDLYHRDFATRLAAAGLEFASKPRHELIYRGQLADVFEPDLVFPGRLVVELKSLRSDFAPEHFTQLFTYLKFCRLDTGLLLNFGHASLGFKRVTFTPTAATFPTPEIPSWVHAPALATRLLHILQHTFATHGLGYRASTWRGLVAAALHAENLSCIVDPTAAIARLGSTRLHCLVIDHRCAVAIGALGDEISATDRATLQTCLRWLDLPWGLAVHFGRRRLDARFVSAPNLAQLAAPAESAESAA
jgi:GxxExxY protein